MGCWCEQIDAQKKRGGVDFRVSVYMAELYRDHLRDLLLNPAAAKTAPKLSIHKDARGMGKFLPSLHSHLLE